MAWLVVGFMLWTAACTGTGRHRTACPPDGVVLADTATSPDGDMGTSGDGAQEVAVDVGSDVAPAACAPNKFTCTRGVIAQCNSDGFGWHYRACPAGELCEGDSCVRNVGLVELVANNPVAPPSGNVGEVPVDSNLHSAVDADWLHANVTCADAFEQGSSDNTVGDLGGALIEKYWIRRLAGDLGDINHRFMLIGPPTDPQGQISAVCQQNTTPVGPDACVESPEPLMSEQQAETALDAAWTWVAGPSDSFHYTPWNTSPRWTQLRRALQAYVKIPPGAGAQQVESWVDGRFDDSSVAAASSCTTDEDCLGASGQTSWSYTATKHCEDGACRRVSNPELNLRPIPYGYDMGPIAYLALAVVARPEGWPCTTNSDCPNRSYACGNDHACHDAAAACRVYDSVWIWPFYQYGPTSAGPSSQCNGGGVQIDPELWSDWMRWGCGCDDAHPCPSGATCRRGCEIGGTPASCGPQAPKLCFPDLVYKEAEPHYPFGALGGLEESYTPASEACRTFPWDQPQDAAGRPFHASVDSIVIEDTCPSCGFPGAFAPQMYATGTALFADGTAITPCGTPPTDQQKRDPMMWPPVMSCDYESRYQAMLEKIRTHVTTSVCTPNKVGLPPRSPRLIR